MGDAHEKVAAGEGEPLMKKNSRSWKSFQALIKKCLHKVSPIPVLTKVADCYIYSVTAAAKHVNHGSLSFGPQISPMHHYFQYSGSQRSRDSYHQQEAVDGSVSRNNMSLPRSATYSGTANRLGDNRPNLGRSKSHSNVYTRNSNDIPNLSRRSHDSFQRTTLPVTIQEE